VRKLFRAVVTQAGEILLVPGDLENAAATVAVDSGDAAAVFGFQSISFPDRPTVPLVGGQDGSTPSSAGHFSTALTALRDYRDASILVLPGCTYEDHSAVYDAAITHAESMTNRMVIVDPKSSVEHRTGKSVKDAAYPASTHAALYYPWLKVANPFHNPETAANKPRTFEIAPSGFVAGLWSRIDGSRGVWKAPAGLEATVRGAQGTTVEVGNDIQDQLNGRGVNCIRSIIGPLVIWGARTLATRTQPDFRYVPVRRTSILIGESLYNALQSAVFEPNKHVLWASLRANVGAFMESLFRAGAFQGAKASDAYFVRCGLDDTMTQRDIDAGVVRVIVGYAPLKPAEFVVIQIQQKLQQQT
jgi:phage tail sheath protein FI